MPSDYKKVQSILLTDSFTGTGTANFVRRASYQFPSGGRLRGYQYSAPAYTNGLVVLGNDLSIAVENVTGASVSNMVCRYVSNIVVIQPLMIANQAYDDQIFARGIGWLFSAGDYVSLYQLDASQFQFVSFTLYVNYDQ